MTLSEDFDKKEPDEPVDNYPPIPAEYKDALVIGQNPERELIAVGRKGEYMFLLRYDLKWRRWSECRTASEVEIYKYDAVFLQKMRIGESE